MKFRSLLFLALVAFAALMPLAPSGAGTVRVKATDNRTFSPATKSVARGTKVVWKNPSGDNHNVSAYSSNWSYSTDISDGPASRVFRARGTYKYRCTLHSRLENGRCEGMCGTIKVG